MKLLWLVLATSIFSGFIGSAVEAATVSADAGKAAYATNCASCHGESLAGKFGPALAGDGFKKKWGSANSPSLTDFIQSAMPPAIPGSLPADVYSSIALYLRQVNQITIADNALTAKAGQTAGANQKSAGSASFEVTQFPELMAGESAPDAYFKKSLDHRDALLKDLSPVTDKLLQNPPASEWPIWRRALDTTGYSPLNQVDRNNVSHLGLGWSLSLSPGVNGMEPLVHDGVMFLDYSGKIVALDATTGNLLWQYSGKAIYGNPVSITQPRTLALYENALYAATLDGQVMALDQHTGKVLWTHTIFQPAEKLQLTVGPLVAHGKVFQGVSGCSLQRRTGCYIVALDAKSGNEIWHFDTIARPGQPGGDSWNGADVEDRYGSSVWLPGTYDPDLDLVYFGTGQTYVVKTLLLPNKRKGESADALYTDSTLALNPDTGKLVWYHQHLAGDVWDLDYAFERTIITLDTPKGPRKAVVTGGKDSIFDVLDAKTGQYLYSADMGFQTLVKSIDPITGRKEINPAAIYNTQHGGTVCPFNVGGRDWLSTSYDPKSGVIYVPITESCGNVSLPTSANNPGHFSLGGWDLIKPKDGDGKFGRLAAYDLKTKHIVWTNRRRAPPASAVLATGGGLLFEGSRDRTFRALDSATGATLWETHLSDTPNSFPITYSVNGVQYVAVIAGGGTPQDVVYRAYTPEISNSTGARSIWVFKLEK